MSNLNSQGDFKRVDPTGRFSLGKKHANQTYSVEQKKDGTLILTPVAIIPERELWLWKNKQALDAVKEGLEQSKRGETSEIGSFEQYASEELED